MKYYAVKRGKTTGIFTDWDTCRDSITGFSGAEYKSFKTEDEAKAYLEDIDIWGDQVRNDIRDGYVVAFCDGSFSQQLNKYSYGVIIIDLDMEIHTLCGSGNNEKFISTRNIIGEVFGAINAMDWAVSNNIERIKIYHDYEGISKWITGEWDADSVVAKMYTNLYKLKFEEVLEVIFNRVKGHSNNKYNDQADELAKSALNDNKKLKVQGDNWFAIQFYSEQKLNSLIADLSQDVNIKVEQKESSSQKIVYRVSLERDSVILSFFNSAKKKLLVQGKNSLVLQMVISMISENTENNDSSVEKILSDAYRISIDSAKVDDQVEKLSPTYDADYPNSVKRLIRQAIININYFVKAEDYAQYAFPALRALEGHIKYLITKNGGTVGRSFNCFNKDQNGSYVYTATIADISYKDKIEKCYNYYKSQRDTLFHFGDVLGSTDSTRILDKKEDADEIIKKCIELIENEM